MSLIKTATIGVIGFLAYRAWRRKTPTSFADPALDETPLRPTPHASVRFDRDTIESEAPRMAQSSRGFGGE